MARKCVILSLESDNITQLRAKEGGRAGGVGQTPKEDLRTKELLNYDILILQYIVALHAEHRQYYQSLNFSPKLDWKLLFHITDLLFETSTHLSTDEFYRG